MLKIQNSGFIIQQMIKKIQIFIILSIIFAAVFPAPAMALPMPTSASDLISQVGINAKAYVVADAQTGEIISSNNADLPWTPASLTKLVTALVVLDTKPKLTKIITITNQNQIAGACNSGGACIKAKAGVKFTVDGLFHAMLLPSANNAASALAASTGLSVQDFAAKMNKKASDLGAIGSHFNEPTGMDPANSITASGYAKIITAAFSNQYLRSIAGLSQYSLHSTNNSKYNQTIKNSDKLVSDPDVQILGAKTGYLNESGYNFASLLKYNDGSELAIVVLGEDHLYSAFAETKQLASLAEEARLLALFNLPATAVLGTSTSLSMK